MTGLTQPVYSVQVAFANNPMTAIANLTWTDITQWVMNLKTTQGRQHETSRVEAGRLQMRLVNFDARFNPFNTASPYYGPFTDGTDTGVLGLVPMKRVRITAQWNRLTFTQATIGVSLGSDWTAGANTTAVRTTAQRLDGNASLQLTSTAAGATSANTATGLSGIAVLGGAAYSAMAWFRANTTTEPVTVGISWYDSSGAFISMSTGPAVTDTNTGWTQATLSAVSPVTAAFAAVVVAVTTTAAGGEVHYCDQMGFFPASNVTTWMPGGPQNIWHGFIESWPMNWPDEQTAYVDVTATDGFKILNQRKFVAGKYAAQVVADGAQAYWRCGDPPGAVALSDSSGNNRPGARLAGYGYPLLGTSGALTNDINNAATADGTWGQAGAMPTVSGGFTMEAWIRIPTGPVDTTDGTFTTCCFSYHPVGLSVQGFAFEITHSGGANDGKVDCNYYNQVALSFTPNAMNDGNWHHYLATRNGTAYAFYVDGQLNTSATAPATPVMGDQLFVAVDARTLAGPQRRFDIDEVAWYNTSFTANQVLTHYQLRLGLLQTASGQRINDLLDLAGWPPFDRFTNTGQSQIQQPAGSLLNSPILQSVYDTVDTENGICFADVNGKITFFDRANPLKSATSAISQITLGEGAEPYDLQGTNILQDDLDIFNDVVIGRQGGQLQESQDTVSQGRYGTRTYQKTNTLDVNDATTFAASQYVLSRYQANPTPSIRVKAIMVHPLADPGVLFPQVLTRILQDRITVQRNVLPGAGTAYSQAADIEYIEHTITPGDWYTLYRLSPADTKQYCVLDDANLAILDSTARLFF